MKFLPLAAVLLVLLLAAAAFLIHALLKSRLNIAADASRCAAHVVHGRQCVPDVSLLTSHRALARWKRTFNEDVDGLTADYEKRQDLELEARRDITLQTLTIQARRELARDRRRR